MQCNMGNLRIASGSYLFWASMVLQFVISSGENSTLASEPISDETYGIGGWIWSPWSNWSPCSKTCGGGVAVQKRRCVSRNNNSEVNSSSVPLIISLGQGAGIGDCIGPSRRYHECNTNPCPGKESDSRAEQCAAYDRRPFRGHYYSWVPYIDGNSPCTLNCRPLGKQFYASLSWVADGTSCNRPGSRAICVQGECKAVGQVEVLSNEQTPRCGRRLVSGIFAQPNLPIGYSRVTTIPRGACKINVTEIASNDNYIALKITNGSYVINGDFAISLPGNYDAAGARFVYKRDAGRDVLLAAGPVLQPVDIMVLYSRDTVGIKYEYFTESHSNENEVDDLNQTATPFSSATAKHMRRHQSSKNYYHHNDFTGYKDRIDKPSPEYVVEENKFNTKDFHWKLAHYSPCSRSCGNGYQTGTYRCLETRAAMGDREVSPIYCNTPAPADRRKRCFLGPCPPRWRTTAWSNCPKCGTAYRRRIAGCVQEHAKGLIKVLDEMCDTPKPETEQRCKIPECFDSQPTTWATNRLPLFKGSSDIIDSFQDGQVHFRNSSKTTKSYGPEYSYGPVAGWLHTEWSECVGWCNGGEIQTREVKCADPAGCAPRQPDVQQSCSLRSCEPYEGYWFTGEWSPCSSNCDGKQVRGVLCIGGTGRHLKDSACKGPKPDTIRDCEGDCMPNWFFSDWSRCSGSCDQENGIQSRTVWCASNLGGLPSEENCYKPKPASERTCKLEKCENDKSDTIPEYYVDSSRVVRNEVPMEPEKNIIENNKTDCEDKVRNCALAVQARLCHYKYYLHNCCRSCQGQ